MWYTLPANTPLYRVARKTDTWAQVLQGLGAYFSTGGRYNGIHQPTIYSSPDPLAALCEFGWHSALANTILLGQGSPLTYPVLDNARLWSFAFTTPLALIDVTDPVCVHRFGYPAHSPYNPHPDRYVACQNLANQVRAWANPPAPHSRPEGVVAPSIRTPAPAGHLPQQIVLFVMPAGVVPQTLQARGVHLGQWDVELEFQTAPSPAAVAATNALVAWSRPQFKLTGNAPVPRYQPRPRSRAIPVNTWQPLPVQYTTY